MHTRWFNPNLAWHTHYLLARPTSPANPPHPPGLTPHWITRPTDPHFPHMVTICSEQGLDETWCRDQLDSGSTCILAMTDHTPIAVGLMTRRLFWIDEIRYCFDPGPQGCYLYATYVSPPHRGQRLQRLLDTLRLHRAATTGAQWAYAIVNHQNTPSLRSHHSSAFHPVARLDQFTGGSRTLTLLRRLTPSKPIGTFIKGTNNDHNNTK